MRRKSSNVDHIRQKDLRSKVYLEIIFLSTLNEKTFLEKTQTLLKTKPKKVF